MKPGRPPRNAPALGAKLKLLAPLDDVLQRIEQMIADGERFLRPPSTFQEVQESVGAQRQWAMDATETLNQLFGDDEYARRFNRIQTQILPEDAGLGPRHEKQLDATQQRLAVLRSIRGLLSSLLAASVAQEQPLPGQSSPTRSLRDPYPTTLEVVREGLDYWATRQGEGVAGSNWEEGVRNRLTHLRNLESRYREQQERKSKEASATLTNIHTFVTPFCIYTPGDPLGSGGSGVVYDVTDDEGQHYALKVLNPGVDAKRMKRFKNEILFCAKNSHPNVIRVLDYGVATSADSQSPFYVMPLFPKTLRKLMSQGIQPADVLRVFSKILDGVEAAHLQGVIHRDLKPENILCDPGEDTLVIADFGIARFKEEDLYTAVETKNRERLANFLYSAPEQRERGKQVDHRADIYYALGLMLNELFTRQVPQGAGFKCIEEAAPSYTYLDKVVDEMIQQDPERRPDSIGKVKEQLIARGNEFVSLQTLNRLKTEVIPETAVDDPIVREPIGLVGVDYGGGMLKLKLSKVPNVHWIRRFANLGNYSAILGKEPRRFTFNQNVAEIPASEQDAQMLVNHFKNYVEATNREYAAEVEANRRAEIERRRRELQQKLAEEEKRQRLLKGLQY